MLASEIRKKKKVMSKYKSLPESERKLIEKFIESRDPPIKESRKRKYRTDLGVILFDLGKPAKEVSKEKLKAYVEKINSSPNLQSWSKYSYRVACKAFFKHVRGDKFVKWIKIGTAQSSIESHDLLTWDEIERMILACGENIRNKAIIATLYETACTPQEFLSLRKDSIIFDEYGAQVLIPYGKHLSRKVRIFKAIPYLSNWIENHPLHDKSAALWVDLSPNTNYEPLKYEGFSRIITKVARDAKIEKRVYGYLFRHTRNTEFYKKVKGGEHLKKFAGWRPNSDMANVYVHLADNDLDDALLEAYGLKRKQETEEKLPKKCPRCQKLCDFNQEICNQCGMGLTIEAMLKIEEERRKEQEKQKALEANVQFLLEEFAKLHGPQLSVKDVYSSPLVKEKLEEVRERAKPFYELRVKRMATEIASEKVQEFNKLEEKAQREKSIADFKKNAVKGNLREIYRDMAKEDS